MRELLDGRQVTSLTHGSASLRSVIDGVTLAIDAYTLVTESLERSCRVRRMGGRLARSERRGELARASMSDMGFLLSARKKARGASLSGPGGVGKIIFPPIIRIPSPTTKPAKVSGMLWRGSLVESRHITLVWRLDS